jgi:uncharacterized protein YxjI
MLLQLNQLIIRREAGILSVRDECTVYDIIGKTLGYVRPAWKAKRGWFIVRLIRLMPYLPRTLRLEDTTGKTILRLVISLRILRTKLRVSYGHGEPVGVIRQRGLFREWRHFDLTSASGAVGVIVAQDDRAWRFRVLDLRGEEMGWIRKRWHGTIREQWTTGSAYDFQLRPEASSELRFLVLAAAVSMDLAFTNRDIGDPWMGE